MSLLLAATPIATLKLLCTWSRTLYHDITEKWKKERPTRFRTVQVVQVGSPATDNPGRFHVTRNLQLKTTQKVRKKRDESMPVSWQIIKQITIMHATKNILQTKTKFKVQKFKRMFLYNAKNCPHSASILSTLTKPDSQHANYHTAHQSIRAEQNHMFQPHSQYAWINKCN